MLAGEILVEMECKLVDLSEVVEHTRFEALEQDYNHALLQAELSTDIYKASHCWN